MYLHINDSMTVEDVQERFNECFPFLKIAFYAKAHKEFQTCKKQDLYPGVNFIGDIRKKHYNNALEIKSWYKTSRVEKDLKEKYGLNAQIFRWDKTNGWIQTSLSDELTLDQQSKFANDPVLM